MATEEPASAASSADLSVSPGSYVGGQLLTWRGNVGHVGERSLVLQFNMGSVAGNWNTVEGFRSRTRADGSFSFAYPAPSMFNIRYRVKAGQYVTPATVFNAKTQDLTVRVTGHRENNTNEPGRVAVGERFGITVDTTPENIFRSPDSKDLPVFEGRALTLQKRVGRSWSTIGSTTVRADGLGYFTGLEEQAGVAVYRVRQENYFTGGNHIGWHPSFPLFVLVGQDAQQWYASRYGTNQPSSNEVPKPPPTPGPQAETASQRYAWFPSVFDFAWEHGQSLDSPPARGTRLRGRWVGHSTGSGRVAKHNGGLALDSKRYTGAGAGDFGTTRAKLFGNAMTHGRWEASMWIRNAYERGGRGYGILAELVPARRADYDCGQHNITIASITPFSDRVEFGVRSPQHRWTGATTAPYTPRAKAYRVAVEVARDHVSWFLNGSAVGSVTSADAVPGVPMTLRLSLVGQGSAEMDQTGLISDWQRGFPISSGDQTTSPRELTRHASAVRGCRAG